MQSHGWNAREICVNAENTYGLAALVLATKGSSGACVLKHKNDLDAEWNCSAQYYVVSDVPRVLVLVEDVHFVRLLHLH